MDDSLDGSNGKSPDFDKNATLKQLDDALVKHDLDRAAAILNKLHDALPDSDLEFKQLYMKVTSIREEMDLVAELYKSGKRALDQGDPDNALNAFAAIMRITPDHAQARAGFQTATRLKEKLEKVVRKLDRAHDARCRGDFETAKELCREVLYLAQENESAKKFLAEMDEWIAKRRQVQILVNQGEQLFDESNFHKAIRVWETIADIDASFDDGIDRIKQAKHAIILRKQEQSAANLLLLAQQALDGGRFTYVLEILASFPNGTPLTIDADVIRKKAEAGIEKSNLLESIAKEIFKLIQLGDAEKARNRFTLLLDADPNSEWIEKVQIKFKEASIPLS